MSTNDFDDIVEEAPVAKKKKFNVEKFFQQWNTLDANNYGGWPFSVKLTVWIFILVGIMFLGYMLLLKPKMDDISNANAQEQNLLNEFRAKDSTLRNLQAYQRQLHHKDIQTYICRI